MLSTKSRFDTTPPGAKKRTSVRFSGETPGTAGHTSGRRSSDTIVCTGSAHLAVNGKSESDSGGFSAARRRFAYAMSGTAILSDGMGRPTSATWNTPCVVRRSLIGLCRTPLSRR
jgi:hypothetical protein